MVKVVAYGNETERQRLHGHSIVVTQRPEQLDATAFGKAAIEAAFAALRIVFVGPSGSQGRLERAALKIYDLRLRPHVLFNWLAIRHALHAGPPPPTIEEVKAAIAAHGGLAAHIRQNARRVTDVGVERAASDVANVRAAAQSARVAALADDAEAEEAAEGDALPPVLSGAGVMEFMPQVQVY